MGHLRDKIQEKANYLLSLIIIEGIAFTLIPYCKSIIEIILVFTLLAFSSSPLVPNILTNISKFTPKNLHEISMSIYFPFIYLAMFLSPLITGYLWNISIYLTFQQAIILSVIALLTILLLCKSMKSRIS